MKHNLFIIRSPLQMMNAYEAINKFSLSNNILLVIDTKGKSNTGQMSDLIDSNYKWDEIIRLENEGKSNFSRYIKLIKKLKNFTYDYVFSGDFGSIHQIIISNMDSKNVYLLDDGTTSILRRYEFQKKKKINFKLLRFSLFGLKTTLKKEVNFFTMFNLEKLGKEKVILNKFDGLKKQFNIKLFKESDNIYFLGQPLVEAGYLSKEVYLEYFNTLLSRFPHKKIVYIAHRAETMLNYLEENVNLEIVHSEKPIEFYFLQKKEYPKEVLGFTSAALFTLSILFEKTVVNSVIIKEKDFTDKFYVMDLIYKYMESSNINMIKLKD